MSAEPKQNTTNEMWTQWEGKVVNGAFPLNRFLGGTSHSGVYLTERGRDASAYEARLAELAPPSPPSRTLRIA